MTRLDLARPAVRVATPPRVLLWGPPGGAVQMVALDVAQRLADRVVVVDAGDGVCLDLADLYAFDVLRWLPLHSVDALTGILAEVADDQVLVVDNFSAWWGGAGGLRDVGHTRGWEHMRGLMSNLVRSVLHCAGPVLLVARADVHTHVEVAGEAEASRFVSRGPFLDEQLIYPWPLALRVDIDANVTVEASRVAGLDRSVTDLDVIIDGLAAWQESAEQPVDRETAAELVAATNLPNDAERRALKQEFAMSFGPPSQLPASQLEAAQAFIDRHTKGEG